MRKMKQTEMPYIGIGQHGSKVYYRDRADAEKCAANAELLGFKLDVVKNPDYGRFNMESETPLLSAEEDQNDFQLFAETYVEFRRNERKAEREAIERAKREREEFKRLAPNLF